ncbi:MAG TPA: amino acid permease [Sedimenticola thiotaurini]|uniref:Amino acid permease n=1 Tax=Sedimenticola thiotaurini TaxID=1543721 RepID=A0A831W842_9GAMM|nr:amino acid permease [Sedimenticola thiotaurini]
MATNDSERLTLKEVIAMGVGGMVGGGIFSVLGLAIAQAGHAAPLAFALGGIIALLTGLSYARLGLHYQSDGGSFTYLERAFASRNIAGMGGWLLLVGYVGTMALYAYTFGVYGAAMLGGSDTASMPVHHLLESLVLLAFLGVNLYGVKASGTSELLIVTIKVLILGLFAVIGLFYVRSDHLLPLFDRGQLGVLMGAALIFVAYEGFELIPNAVDEMEDPQRNLRRGILWSIGITIFVYVLVSLVAVGNLLPEEIRKYGEYALAEAARPFLGQAGFLLIGLAALFSTSSAINATMFGAARLGMVMATDDALPRVFGFRRRQNDIPWVSLIAVTLATLAFVNLTDLTIISSFASSTFLLIFAAINLSAWRLRHSTGGGAAGPLAGLLLSLASWLTLMAYLWHHSRTSIYWIGAIYLGVIASELLFSRRRLILRPATGS